MNWDKLLSNERLRPSGKVAGADTRNAFESDYGRIIFSSATRRMHDKTQVFPLTADDNIHSRLTHSLEVMAIGHSLGTRLCENEEFLKRLKERPNIFREIPMILQNACLIHDIGNPPFGHFGEDVIKEYFKSFFKKNDKRKKKNRLKLTKDQKLDFTEFDGNAQGFRVVTKLQNLNDEFGLNLTNATLAAYLKYPNADISNDASLSTKKHGVLTSEREFLKEVADKCGLEFNGKINRHPLSFLMEAADSICYLVMDIEDGFNKAWYDFDDITRYLIEIDGIKNKRDDILTRDNGYGLEITRMVSFRIYLIQRLVDLAIDNFIKNLDKIEDGNYDKELIWDDPNNLADTLEKFCIDNIFPKREITSLELTGHSVLTGLLDYYINFITNSSKGYVKRANGLILNGVLRTAYLENGLPSESKITDLNDYYKLRVIVDYITGMTDLFALNHFQKLSGQKIN
jgi:dGTPase